MSSTRRLHLRPAHSRATHSRAAHSRAAQRRLRGAALLATALLAPVLVAPALGAPAVAAPTPSSSDPEATEPGTTPLRPTSPGDPLGPADRALLSEARQTGERRVDLMLATAPGSTAAVVRDLRAQGAWIGTVEDEVGYVRASVPTARVVRAAALPRVQSADLARPVSVEPPKAEVVAADATGPSAATPNANPYLPTGETGSVTFKRKHPKADGRGIRIGIVDSGVDLDHPALQKTSTGARKIADWVTGTDPVLDDDPTWVPMLTDAAGTDFSYEGIEWTAPAGDHRVGLFREGPEAVADVDRDGTATDVFGVLYDSQTHDVWVDRDQDHAFESTERLRDYAQSQQVGHFGTDDPATPIQESMPFVVQHRDDVDLAPLGQVGRADFVNIGVVTDSHGTHVAGIAAGHGLLGGAMDGQAPGAQIVSSRVCRWEGDCTDAGLLDGVVDLAVHRDVDVINISIGMVTPLSQPDSVQATLYRRLAARYGVQIVNSAGNSGPGVNSIDDLAGDPASLPVAASVSRATRKATYGSTVPMSQNLFPFSSRGPSDVGGSTPAITAPGSAVSSIPLWYPEERNPLGLPNGYAMHNGTSMAAPQATGAAAVLLSATRAAGLRTTPRQLRDALLSSANPISGVERAGQGAGLIDVPGAYSLLMRRGPAPASWTSDASVCSATAFALARPYRGTGLYQHCPVAEKGLVLGRTVSSKVMVRRSTGPKAARTYRVRIVGGDGTFSAPRTVRVARAKSAAIAVRTRTRTVGLHSAILEIDDPATAVVDHRVALTAVQSQALAKADGTRSWTGQVSRDGVRRYFVDVPSGTDALAVRLSGLPASSKAGFVVTRPDGLQADDTTYGDCFTNDPRGERPPCDPLRRSFSAGQPGVWEIDVMNAAGSATPTAPFRLDVSGEAVDVTPQRQEAPAGDASVSWSLRNRGAAFSVVTAGGALGSVREDRPRIDVGGVLERTVTVPAGTTRLAAGTSSPDDASADLDVAITGPDGTLVAASANAGSEEFASMEDPPAGVYTVRVIAYDLPDGPTSLDYRDLFQSPELGSLTVDPTPRPFARGASMTVDGTFSPAAGATVEAGRTVFGLMDVLDDAGALLESVEVSRSS